MQYNPALYPVADVPILIPASAVLQENLTLFLSKLQISTSSPHSVRTARSILTRYVRYLQAAAGPLVPSTFAFVSQFQAPSYRCVVINYLRHYWRSAGLPDSANPGYQLTCPKVNPTEGNRAFTREDLQAIFKVLRDHRASLLREAAVIHLLLFTGLRAGELLALEKYDVSASRGVYVRNSKNNTSRQLSISAEALAAISAFHKAHPSSSPFVFYPLDGRACQLSYSALWRGIKHVYDLAGVDAHGVGLHALRHTYVRALEEEEQMDIEVLQRLLGHANSQTTRLYRRLNDVDLRRRGPAIGRAIRNFLGG